MMKYIETHWVAAALFAAVLLFALAPVGIGAGDRATMLVYLAMPVYMLHQAEEHLGDRFRRFANEVVFGGHEGLTVADMLVINLPGVWGLNLVALYAACWIGAGWGLAAGYLILVNGISHVGLALRLRRYNPGFATALALFLPFGVASMALVPATVAQHAFGLAVSLVIHAAIAAHALKRVRIARGAIIGATVRVA